jgi:hypothetical protein
MSMITRKHGASGQTESRAAQNAAAPGGPRSALPISESQVTREQIQARAYQIYEARRSNGGPGDAKSDWLQAERELDAAAAEPNAAAHMQARARSRGEVLLAGGE